MNDSDAERVEKAISAAFLRGLILHIDEESPGYWQAWVAPRIPTRPLAGVHGRDLTYGLSEVEAAETGLALLRTERRA